MMFMFDEEKWAQPAHSRHSTVFGNILKTIRALVSMLRDIVILMMPQMRDMNAYVFVVHPRDVSDVYRQFPAFQYLPQWLVYLICRYLPPLTLSKITGAQTAEGTQITGYLVTSSLTPAHMVSMRRSAIVRRNNRLAKFVKRLGARHVGLGALVPAMTHYGMDLRKYYGESRNPPYITTGHSLTALTIFQYLEGLVEVRNPTEPVCVAIVGAAGSTGSLCARIIAHWDRAYAGTVKLLLVDVREKTGKLAKLKAELADIAPFEIETSIDLMDLRQCNYVITVTNAAKSIIEPEHLAPGTIVIDDSQPRNTSPELLEHGIAVIDVLAEIPGLKANFDFGFNDLDTSALFTCLAEVVALAATREDGDFSIGQVPYDRVVRLRELLKQTDIGPAPLHTFTRLLSSEEVSRIYQTPKRPRPMLTASG